MEIVWDETPEKMVERLIDRYMARIAKGITEIANRRAPEIAAWMQANHRWQNQTGAAEAGLHTTVEQVTAMMTEITLSHGESVPYGIWLEVAHQGVWGVLTPAVDHWGPILMNDIQQLVGG